MRHLRINTFMCVTFACTTFACLTFAGVVATAGPATHAAPAPVVPADKLPKKIPKKMRCDALQTVGLHDYEGAPESYQPSTFFESTFELRINNVLTRHLANQTPGAAEANPDLFLTLRPLRSGQPGEESPIELRCRQIQGLGGELGYSCSNTPPSEFLLLNPSSLRFTRTSIGGWAFADQEAPEQETTEQEAQPEKFGGHMGNDSLFVEYGTCK